MTVKAILAALAQAGKNISRVQIYRYFTRLKIKPARRQRPAIYPADTAARILAHLGIVPALNFSPLAPLDTAAARLPSMRELRRARKHTNTTKAKHENKARNRN